MNTLSFTPLQNKLFRLLCIRAGEQLNQRTIAKALGATPAGVAKALTKLQEHHLAHVKKQGTMNLNLVTLERNQATMQLKKLENLKQLYEINLVQHLEEHYPGTTIILFGSYARGEDTITSDIDIAIEGTKNSGTDLTAFEKKLERKINIMTYNTMKNIHKELRENLCNGIVLAGSITL